MNSVEGDVAFLGVPLVPFFHDLPEHDCRYGKALPKL